MIKIKIEKIDKKTFDERIKKLESKFIPLSNLNTIEIQWVSNLEWNGTMLTSKNIRFINEISKKYNISNLTKSDTKKIEKQKIKHEKQEAVFKNDKIKRWFVYLGYKLKEIIEGQNELLEKLSKEEIFPNRLNEEEIEELDELIEKHSKDEGENEIKPDNILQEKVNRLLKEVDLPEKYRTKYTKYSEGKGCNFCDKCPICGEVESDYNFHFNNEDMREMEEWHNRVREKNKYRMEKFRSKFKTKE